MAKSDRLIALIQSLRGYRLPVSAERLSGDLGVSVRTIYRDIDALRAQGADIEGEAGIGYVLRPGFLLPPLMFSEEEIEALVTGARFVEKRGDKSLAEAARAALTKISAVLPEGLLAGLESERLMVAPPVEMIEGPVDPGLIRAAIRREQSLDIIYDDLKGNRTARRIWPAALGYFERLRVVIAWCELRGDLRHFRVDRIASITPTGKRYPRRRASLIREWREKEGIAMGR